MGRDGVEGEVLAVAVTVPAVEGDEEVGEEEVEGAGYEGGEEEALSCLSVCVGNRVSGRANLHDVEEAGHGMVTRRFPSRVVPLSTEGLRCDSYALSGCWTSAEAMIWRQLHARQTSTLRIAWF